MNLDNLQEDYTYKNYKELCRVLDEPIKSGDSKKAQLKIWEQYFSWEKEGYKFKIIKKHKFVIENKNRKVTHVKLIEDLILNMVACGGSDRRPGEQFISQMDLMLYLQLIKNEYRSVKPKRGRLSTVTNIPTEYIDDFYQATNKFLKRNIETALNDLKNRSLIFWQNSTAVAYWKNNKDKTTNRKHVYENEYGEIADRDYETVVDSHLEIREATQEEYGLILDAEKYAMNKLGFKTKTGIFLAGAYVKFRMIVNDYLFKNYNIAYYFPAYRILYPQNLKNINDYLEELDQYILMDDEELKEKKLLNSNTVERLKASIAKKYKNKKYVLRQDENYIKFNNRLIDELINIGKQTWITSEINRLPEHKKKKIIK